MALDRQVRNEAVAQRATIFGHNYHDYTDYDLTKGAWTLSGGYSDLCGILGISTVDGSTVNPNPQPVNSVRIMQPHQGEVVECYIDFISIRTATDALGAGLEKGGLGMVVAIGDFTNNDFTTPRTSYTIAEVMASWKRISGRSTPLPIASGGDFRIYASRLNLLPELYKNGTAKFVEDGFNLLICFTDPDGLRLYTPIATGAGSNFKLENLRIAQAITGVK